MLVHGVDEDGSTGIISQNALENTSIKISNSRLRNKEIQPRMRDIPQPLGSELQLGRMNPVEKVHIT